MDDDLDFDFEKSLQQNAPAAAPGPVLRPGSGAQAPSGPGPHNQLQVVPQGPRPIGHSYGGFQRNYRQTVCSYWLKGLCMKGEDCGFLHVFDPARLPVCRNLIKFGECKEPDCPFKHSLEDVKECNMYKLGFCVYGPRCRFRHTRLPGPPPEPETVDAAKPREFRHAAGHGPPGSGPGRGGFGRGMDRPYQSQQPLNGAPGYQMGMQGGQPREALMY